MSQQSEGRVIRKIFQKKICSLYLGWMKNKFSLSAIIVGWAIGLSVSIILSYFNIW